MVGALAALRHLGPVAMYGEGFWRPTPRPPWPTRSGSARDARCPAATDTLGFALLVLRA